jgi:DNA polymerase III subunit alpha
VKLASAAYLEGFYFKPRIDKELLEAAPRRDHLPLGLRLQRVQPGDPPRRGAEEELREAIGPPSGSAVFGDRYFIEIMNNGVEIQRLALEGAVEVAKKLGIPLVATSDAHYVDREDAEAQDVLLCINTGKFRTDTNRMRMDGEPVLSPRPEEMYEHFPRLEDAVARSQEIADSASHRPGTGQAALSRFPPLPQEKTAEDYLRELCIQGLKERYAGDDEMCPNGELSPS